MSGEKFRIDTAVLTPEEIEDIRAQMREANSQAREAVIKRGVKLHPRVAALLASGIREVER